MIKLPKENAILIKKVLGSSYYPINIKSISTFDNLELGVCTIQLCLHDDSIIDATGVGMVDAIFLGLKAHYIDSYPSLDGLTISSFSLRAKSKGTKSEVESILEIQNSYDNTFSFIESSKSLTGASSAVSVAAVEYFCNSEKAYLAIKKALSDAQSRNRDDLIIRYTSELSMLVRSTCYANIKDI